MINKTNINKVLNKLPKDKVKLEQVQLSASNDMKKMASKMKPLMKQGQTYIKKIEAIGGQLQKNISVAKTVLAQAEKIQQDGYTLLDPARDLLEKVENAAKELGVKPETIDGYAELKEVRGQAYYDYKGMADAYWENINGLDGDLAALKNIAPL